MAPHSGGTDTQLVRSLQEHLRHFLLSTADSSGAAGLASFQFYHYTFTHVFVKRCLWDVSVVYAVYPLHDNRDKICRTGWDHFLS